MDGWTDRRAAGRISSLRPIITAMERWAWKYIIDIISMDVISDGWMDGWMNGWLDGRVDG